MKKKLSAVMVILTLMSTLVIKQKAYASTPCFNPLKFDRGISTDQLENVLRGGRGGTCGPYANAVAQKCTAGMTTADCLAAAGIGAAIVGGLYLVCCVMPGGSTSQPSPIQTLFPGAPTIMPPAK